ncbi:MAG: hypothetical protein J6X91_09030 [Bacteroidales bacterium]|nr:hypothetical protein [Bacteroidales bacterium]
MMRWARYLLALCLVMLCCTAYSQRRDARDKALDRYEAVCNRLIELRDALRRGETISSQELSALRTEVKTIRSNLQKSPEGLTPEQTKRFNRIRRRYNYGYELEELPVTKAAAVSAPATCRKKDGRQELERINYDRYILPGRRYFDEGKTGFLALAQLSPAPDMSFGVSLGYLKRKAGAYASFVSNFKSRSADMEVLSDGTIGGDPVWVSGRQEKTKMVFTAGGILRVSDNVSLLAGAGYGTRKLFWEDTGGKWMRVTDCSYSGIAAEAGMLFTLGLRGSFCLSAKAGTISFKYLDFTVGVGYRF